MRGGIVTSSYLNMKSLSFEDCLILEGGKMSCEDGAGYATAVTISAVAVAVLTSPIALSGLAVAAVLGASGVSAAAVLNCLTQ